MNTSVKRISSITTTINRTFATMSTEYTTRIIGVSVSPSLHAHQACGAVLTECVELIQICLYCTECTQAPNTLGQFRKRFAPLKPSAEDGRSSGNTYSLHPLLLSLRMILHSTFPFLTFFFTFSQNTESSSRRTEKLSLLSSTSFETPHDSLLPV